MRYEFVTPEEAKLMEKALQCIEYIAEDSCPGPSNHKDDCVFCLIFKLAHAGLSPSCKTAHPKWEEDLNRQHEAFSEEKIV